MQDFLRELDEEVRQVLAKAQVKTQQRNKQKANGGSAASVSPPSQSEQASQNGINIDQEFIQSVFRRAGRTFGTKSFTKKIVSLSSSDVLTAIKERGNISLRSGDIANSVAYYQAGIALISSFSPSDAAGFTDLLGILWSNLSGALASAGVYELALESAEQCILAKPDWSKGYSRKGLALFKLGRFEDAVSAFKEGLAKDPENTELSESVRQAEAASTAEEFNVLGEEQLARGRYEAAADFFRKACLRDPAQRVYWANAAEAMLQTGQYEEALNCADSAIRLQPTWVKPIEKRAIALSRLNRYDEAAATYTHLSQMHPTNVTYQKSVVDMQTEAMRHRARQKMEGATSKQAKQ